MYRQGRIGIAVSILVCFILQAQGADKTTDENRPYEFGFNVEVEGMQQQHRHEKKDKDGIIMGEFGFVTADDVYHVTVYATDKEGRFKILSMKNIHLKSSPGAGAAAAVSARQGHSLTLPATPAASGAPPAAPSSQPQEPFKQVSLEPPGRSCSSCSIPTTTKVPPPASFAPQNQQAFSGGFGGQPTGSQASPNGGAQGGYGNQPLSPQTLPNYAQQGGNQPASPQDGSPNYAQQGPGVPQGGQPFAQQPGQGQQNFPGSPGNAQAPNAPGSFPQAGPNAPFEQAPGQLGQQGGQQYSNGLSSGPNAAGSPGAPGRTSKQYTGPEQQFTPNAGPQRQSGSEKPTLVSAQMQIVDKNTDIHALRPGEKHGLPAGLSEDDMTQLLYTFNYTVGFHGHFEEGYRNGAKKGYYFVTGRNGVRTRIDYTADETGFHPKVSQEVLDLLSDDVPKPETEKDEKYGLKGYEFKWLYYPVESHRR